MRTFKLVFYISLLAAFAVVFVLRSQIFDYFRPVVENKIQELEKAAAHIVIQELQKKTEATPQINTPPPLRVPAEEISQSETETSQQTDGDKLTVLGTIKWTNEERKIADLPELKNNSALGVIASLRMEDMFARQYFAHVAPDGSDVKGSAEEVGYEYITLGENLALGGFKNDEDLVAAWMASPGHKENILKKEYEEIGVAVGEGFYEGRKQFIAVQVFARPLSSCPAPDEALKARIELLSSQSAEMKKDLDARKEEIDNSNSHSPSYNVKVKEYNDLVAQYNYVIEEIKVFVPEYNSLVELFNKCIGR